MSPVVTRACRVRGVTRSRKDRNRTVLTISRAGTTLTHAGSRMPGPTLSSGVSRATTVAMTTAAAPGLGSPTK